VPAKLPPVKVTVSPPEAATTLAGLLEDYFAVLDDARTTVTIEPIDDMRRGVVIYRVIQASRTVAAQHPESTQFLVTEEGSRWRLPPPAL
jgi:hypothetical protein